MDLAWVDGDSIAGAGFYLPSSAVGPVGALLHHAYAIFLMRMTGKAVARSGCHGVDAGRRAFQPDEEVLAH